MTDERKGGVWGDHTRAGADWSDEEDDLLLRWGAAVGYDFVAGHDFDRAPQEGSARVAWLREHKPALVKHIAEELAWEASQTEPRDMRRKENRRHVQ